jgi:hypothetical protein
VQYQANSDATWIRDRDNRPAASLDLRRILAEVIVERVGGSYVRAYNAVEDFYDNADLGRRGRDVAVLEALHIHRSGIPAREMSRRVA